MAVEGISSLLEPLIIVFLGGMVGFIVIALFMPLIDDHQEHGRGRHVAGRPVPPSGLAPRGARDLP